MQLKKVKEMKKGVVLKKTTKVKKELPKIEPLDRVSLRRMTAFKANYSLEIVDKILDTFFDTLYEDLTKYNEVNIPQLGSFKIRLKEAYEKPCGLANGEIREVPEKIVVKYIPRLRMKEELKKLYKQVKGGK